ncbi:protein PML-like isoform X1 [Haliotis rubra]|uniref:protein PML-like isoform X1 n=2 Tax=Haliotis rubra TaxID=36100 RepID=UPI001EE5BA58|nr:protein PML-like isoform X1 [Haliotis rubra]
MDSGPVSPNCVVCSTSFRYKGPQPHLLPCLHPVCEDCLESVVLTTLLCSICMESHDRNGRNFPVDEVVLEEVFRETAKHLPSSFVCGNKQDGNEAECWCEECGIFFCRRCEKSHGEIKATRNHKMQWTFDLSSTGTGLQTKCEEHGQPLDIYDIDCDCFICPQCFYDEHTDHNTQTADRFLTDEKENLSDYMKSISDKTERIAVAHSNVDRQEEVIEQKATSLREVMKFTFSDLRSMLDQREKQMLAELDHLLDSMRIINDSRRPVLKSSETICQSLLDYIKKTLLYASPTHLHKLKSSITQACESCIGDEVPTVHRLESSVVFSKQRLHELMLLVSSFGTFLTPVEADQADEITSLESVREMTLKSTITKLQTQQKDAEEEIESLRGSIQTLQEEVDRLRKTIVSLDNKVLNGHTYLHVLERDQDCAITAIECPVMMFDPERVNRRAVHIHKQMLINRRHWPNKSHGIQADPKRPALKNYCGTCCTSPLPSSGLVYWEVEADVELDKPLGDGILLLEVGVCAEDVMDSSAYITGQPSSSSLLIGVSDNSNTIALCLTVDGHSFVSKDDVVDNDTGTHTRLQYGVLLDMDEMKICYLDIIQREVLGCGHLRVMGSAPELWPMFGVYHGPRSVAMKIVGGQEIKMEDWKKELLQGASSP